MDNGVPANQPSEGNLKELISTVETDLLFHIIWNMRQRKISLKEARHLAKDFLALLPVVDKQDLLNKLNALGEKYPEAQAVFLKHAAPHEEAKRQEAISKMTEHIRSGNLEEALTVAKGGTTSE